MKFSEITEHLGKRGFVTRAKWRGASALFFGMDNIAYCTYQDKRPLEMWHPDLSEIKGDDWIILDLFWISSYDNYLPFKDTNIASVWELCEIFPSDNMQFRAWDLEKKQLFRDVAIDGDGNIGINDHDDKFNIGGLTHTKIKDIFWKPANFFIVTQKTGIIDAEWRPIYSGDIVQYYNNSSYDGINFMAQWSLLSNRYVFKSKDGDILENDVTPTGNRFDFIKIVGNIFENPELMS